MSEVLINKEKLAKKVEFFKSNLNVDRLYFALKANSDPLILKELHKNRCFFEVASINEYNKAIEAGASSNTIICGLPVKPLELLERIGNEGLEYFVFDKYEEFEKMQRYISNSKMVLRVRVSDIDKESYEWGMTIEEIEQAIKANDTFIDSIQGLSFHISRNYKVVAMQKVLDRIEYIISKYFYNKKMILNIGGGIRSELSYPMNLKYDLDKFYSYVNERIIDLKGKYDLDVFCEPGRGIVESCCSIMTTTDLVVERDDGVGVYIDLNISSPIGSIPSRIVVVSGDDEEEVYDVSQRLNKEKYVRTSFYDTVCECKHFFTLPLSRKLKNGEKIKMYGMGAYTTVLSSAFHSRSQLFSRYE